MSRKKLREIVEIILKGVEIEVECYGGDYYANAYLKDREGIERSIAKILKEV